MRVRGEKVDPKLINTAISACLRASQWELVLQLYGQLPKLAKFVPNAVTYSLALTAACNLKNSSKIIEVRNVCKDISFVAFMWLFFL